jgi:hypothetical protein
MALTRSEFPFVAALFVDPRGTYANQPGVDLWVEERDARLYDGPWPVVAHPPCARWSRLAGFTQFRFGLKRGDDGGCFEAALRAVRAYGGVIEHPAYSDAWRAFHLPRPVVREGWTLDLDGGASCYVEQGRYGLPVKKATWLYAFGVELPELRWGWTRDSDGDPGNQNDHGGLDAWRDTWGGRRAAWEESLESHYDEHGVRHRPSHLGQSSTTPPAFRDALLAMARTVRVPLSEAVA